MVSHTFILVLLPFPSDVPETVASLPEVLRTNPEAHAHRRPGGPASAAERTTELQVQTETSVTRKPLKESLTLN